MGWSWRRAGLAAFGLNEGVVVERASGIDVLRGGNDVVIAREDDRDAGGPKARGMGGEAFEPGQLIAEFGAGLRVAVGEVERGNQDASDGSFDVARLRVGGVAGEGGAGKNRFGIAGEDGDAVPRALALPDRVITEGTQSLGGEIALPGLELLETDDIGTLRGQPVEQVAQALIDVINVESSELQERPESIYQTGE